MQTCEGSGYLPCVCIGDDAAVFDAGGVVNAGGADGDVTIDDGPAQDATSGSPFNASVRMTDTSRLGRKLLRDRVATSR